MPVIPLWSISNFNFEVEVRRENTARYKLLIDLCIPFLVQFCGFFSISFFLNVLSVLFTLLTSLVFLGYLF